MTEMTDLKDRVKDHASDISSKAADAAKSKIGAEAEQTQQTAADQVQQTADATQAAAAEFDRGSPQAQAAQQVADRIEGVASDLRTADLEKLADQATDMARRNPMLFVGGAALAGFAIARFLKSSAPRTAYRDQHDDPWSRHPQSMPHQTGGPRNG